MTYLEFICLISLKQTNKQQTNKRTNKLSSLGSIFNAMPQIESGQINKKYIIYKNIFEDQETQCLMKKFRENFYILLF